MAIRMIGAEFRKYYADEAFWPEGYFHDDAAITINGRQDDDGDLTAVQDTDDIEISGGSVYAFDFSTRVSSMERHIQDWRKLQTTRTLLVEAPVDQLESVMTAIRDAGGTIRLVDADLDRALIRPDSPKGPKMGG